MTLSHVLLSAFLLTSCLCTSQAATGHDKQAPLACNLKAFTPEERAEWRALIDELRSAASPSRELTNGYEFEIQTSKTTLAKVARWVELERKCCPFFDFRLNVHGANGTLSLALTGGEGVKQFTAEDFRPWFHGR